MANRITKRIKPKNGVAHIFHIVFTILLPILVFITVRINFAAMALVLIILSKWRMFAVKPRHWPANIRANAIDILVGVSFLIFMLHSGSQLYQLIWAVAYGVWLLLIKPSSWSFAVSVQALIGQAVGLTALFLHFGDAPTVVLVVSTWAICYFAARHFFTTFEEPLTRLLSYLWGYFGAAVAWLLCHWLRFYPDPQSGPVAQPALILNVMAFGLATLYYLDETDRLSTFYKRQIILIMVLILVIIIVFSGWSDKTI